MLSSMAERKQQRMSRTAVLKLVRTFDYLRAVLVLAAFGGPPHMRRVFPTCRPWPARTHDRLWLRLFAHSGAPSELPFEIAQTPTGVASVPFLWWSIKTPLSLQSSDDRSNPAACRCWESLHYAGSGPGRPLLRSPRVCLSSLA
jgi:hypothetical protein